MKVNPYSRLVAAAFSLVLATATASMASMASGFKPTIKFVAVSTHPTTSLAVRIESYSEGDTHQIEQNDTSNGRRTFYRVNRIKRTFTGLKPGTVYAYRARRLEGKRWSSWSNQISMATDALPSIGGSLYDQKTGTPLAKARVEIEQVLNRQTGTVNRVGAVYTDINGHYDTTPLGTGGLFRVVAHPEGYFPLPSLDINVRPDRTVQANLALRRRPSITLESDGSPVVMSGARGLSFIDGQLFIPRRGQKRGIDIFAADSGSWVDFIPMLFEPEGVAYNYSSTEDRPIFWAYGRDNQTAIILWQGINGSVVEPGPELPLTDLVSSNGTDGELAEPPLAIDSEQLYRLRDQEPRAIRANSEGFTSLSVSSDSIFQVSEQGRLLQCIDRQTRTIRWEKSLAYNPLKVRFVQGSSNLLVIERDSNRVHCYSTITGDEERSIVIATDQHLVDCAIDSLQTGHVWMLGGDYILPMRIVALP